MTQYVFVTGGVVSSLGKGITAASLAAILEARGLKITMLKLDPYINVDPGTMSPYQHGEVFVTEDGAETDLDLGHYERFIRTTMTQKQNFTTAVFTRALFVKSVVATITAAPFKLFLILPMKSNAESVLALLALILPWLRLAVP